jgi:hypothetical protein
MLELATDSPLSELQLQLYRDIQRLHARYQRETSLRVYVLGCGRPPKVPGRKKRK